ncbi:efflux RND transporter permease subunit [Geothrix sp.]|jgi:cobalt-zinc-cadmium resistance protein CzcA|uniref:efflux RND transporter permease subunit n=1 Tax=Geothrix sp. TaxID=1962974 RepID=UPI0025BBAF00|nr:efflux RND transporter permease subunit [Geothrix sp.]
MSKNPHALLTRWFAWLLPKQGLVYGATLLLACTGILTFFNLKRDLIPDLSLPSLQLLIQSPGRAAAELELTVAQPVEQAVGGLPGVRRVVSTVQAGLVQVVIAFEGDTDPWRSRQLVGERISSLMGGFPPGTLPPLVTSAAGRLQEIQELVLTGPGVGPMALRDHAVKGIVPRLQAVPGVARVEALGGEAKQIQVLLRPDRMRLQGVPLSKAMEALEGSDQDGGAGILELQDKGWFVTLGSAAPSPDELRRLPIQTQRGTVYLGEVADIQVGAAFRRGLSTYRGVEAVSLRVVKQPTAEALSTAQSVREALPELRKGLPEGMKLEMFYDQGEFVRHALSGVTLALMLGGGFVGLVLVVLLGNFRGALVVIILLPLATLGAALPLMWMGLGLNALTLGGLAISVGLLVDAGVIMVENLTHRLHQAHAGNPASRRATLVVAASEVGIPILIAVLVILAVFIPLLAIGGVAGKLYAPLAVAVGSAMTLSLILSFTLVPTLVERFLPPGTVLEEPRFVTRLKEVYRPALTWALSHGAKLLAVAGTLTAASIVLALGLGSNFLPSLDEGAFILTPNFPAETSLEAVDQGNQMLGRRIRQVPGVKDYYRRTGRGDVTEDPMPHYSSDILVLLQPGADPKKVEAALGALAEDMPYPVELTTPMNMKISEGLGGTPADLQVKLFNPDMAALEAAVPNLRKKLAELPGVKSVAPDTGGPLPKWQVKIDDRDLRHLGVPRPLLLQTLQAALQGLEAAPRYDGPQRIGRVVKFQISGDITPERLQRLPLVLEDGRVLELGQVVTFEESTTPSMIRRESSQRRLALNLRTEGDLGGAAKRVDALLASHPLPKGTVVKLGGRIEEARETQRRLLIAVVVALGIVVGLLYVALGRWWEVTVVLATLPNAFAGGLFSLWLAGETWNVSSIVGMIGLFGVAVQNSLVLITQTKDLYASGLSLRQSVLEASLGRVRPKLMTAGAAILGLLPMLLGFGGSELERPLAIVMVGGLVTSTLFTLLVLPGFYEWMGKRRGLEVAQN